MYPWNFPALSLSSSWHSIHATSLFTVCLPQLNGCFITTFRPSPPPTNLSSVPITGPGMCRQCLWSGRPNEWNFPSTVTTSERRSMLINALWTSVQSRAMETHVLAYLSRKRNAQGVPVGVRSQKSLDPNQILQIVNPWLLTIKINSSRQGLDFFL